MGNPFVHVELHTNDIKTVKQFYSALFDWKLQDIPGFGYTMVNVGEGTAGGMCVDSENLPAWRPYVQVEDIHAATEESGIIGGKDYQRGHRSPDDRLVQRHCRSNRRHPRTLATESALTGLDSPYLRNTPLKRLPTRLE